MDVYVCDVYVCVCVHGCVCMDVYVCDVYVCVISYVCMYVCIVVVLRNVLACCSTFGQRSAQDFQHWRLRDKHTGPSRLAELEQLH